jgi:pilus assembly protein CpaD
MKYEHTSVLLACSAARAPARALAALSLAVIALAGCGRLGERPEPVAGWALVDSAHRHPILVSQEPETMNVRVSRGAQGLTPKQRADILDFAGRSRASDAGNSRLVISAPSGGANEVSSMYAVNQIRRILSDNGFAESSIAVEAYHDDTDRDPPVRVSYLRYVAQGPECGSWPTNLASERTNLPYPNFGCATQRNFAAMVANPGDLLGPRTETDRPGERRDAVWDKYVQGESTVSKKTEDEKVQVKSN